MPLLELPPLQLAVLSLLPEKGELRGQDIKIALVERGEATTSPAFYQLMGRLEKAGFVKSRPEREIVGKQRVTVNYYWITESGQAIRSRVWEKLESLKPRRLGIAGVSD
jgi:DNA-binding PadR family transcriptional regulator